MGSRHAFRVFSAGRVRWVLLALLVVAEIALIAGLRFSAPRTRHGFLVKNGPEYILFWKRGEKYETATYKDLPEAVDYANKELGLVLGQPLHDSDLESLWLQDGVGTYVLKWKTFHFTKLHHLTFSRESDAKYFEAAFRSGAYSPSPFGHSVFLSPALKSE